MTFLIWAATWFGASALIALAWPLLAWRRAARGSALRRKAGCLAFASAWVAIVTTCFALGVTFAWHPANALAVAVAYACAGALALYAFRMPSLWLVIPVGLSCVLAWVGLGLLHMLQNEDYPPRILRLDNGLVCRSSSDMVFLSPSARSFVLYRRYAVVDIEAAHWGYQDGGPASKTSWPAQYASAFETCTARADQIPTQARNFSGAGVIAIGAGAFSRSTHSEANTAIPAASQPLMP